MSKRKQLPTEKRGNYERLGMEAVRLFKEFGPIDVSADGHDGQCVDIATRLEFFASDLGLVELAEDEPAPAPAEPKEASRG